MISDSIIQTLAYSTHFSFPLTLEEIHMRLCSSEPCSLERVFGTLKSMLKAKTICRAGNYYHLPGGKSLVMRRLKRAKLSAPQLQRARSLALRLGRTPGVLAIYLTGSLAMHNSDLNSDIDFMIIAQNHRLWTARLLLTLYTSLLGLRRTPHSTHNTGKLCLNLYLTPHSYLIPKEKHSLYTSYELIQAIPLYDPTNTHMDLLAANSWISKFLPNFSSEAQTPLQNTNANTAEQAVSGKSSFWSGANHLFDLFESLAYHLQLLYMHPKLTREYVTPDSAFFHPHDPAPKM